MCTFFEIFKTYLSYIWRELCLNVDVFFLKLKDKRIRRRSPIEENNKIERKVFRKACCYERISPQFVASGVADVTHFLFLLSGK